MGGWTLASPRRFISARTPPHGGLCGEGRAALVEPLPAGSARHVEPRPAGRDHAPVALLRVSERHGTPAAPGGTATGRERIVPQQHCHASASVIMGHRRPLVEPLPGGSGLCPSHTVTRQRASRNPARRCPSSAHHQYPPSNGRVDCRLTTRVHLPPEHTTELLPSPREPRVGRPESLPGVRAGHHGPDESAVGETGTTASHVSRLGLSRLTPPSAPSPHPATPPGSPKAAQSPSKS